MLAKLCIVIMAVALTAASLLTVRQQRLDAVYDMSRSIERAAAHDRKLQEVRISIARWVTPDSVRTLAARHGEFQPIPLEWCDPVLMVLHTAVAQDPADVYREAPMQTEPSFTPPYVEGERNYGRTVLGPGFGPRADAQEYGR